ncbi:hypothetical protein V6N12_074619 [Hibiscus sabdariffa]|uniref:Uncharacterized protein n=1 Tax=Hibiscus sabdariffa TaxID=183260 RepID=A0ABR2BZ94_9ROSI
MELKRSCDQLCSGFGPPGTSRCETTSFPAGKWCANGKENWLLNFCCVSRLGSRVSCRQLGTWSVTANIIPNIRRRRKGL